MATVETTLGVLKVLSLEEVEEAVTSGRTRGSYLADCEKFFASGELAADFSEKYPKVESGSLRNSVNQNAKKVENHPEFRIVLVPNGDKKHVVLINMTAYNLSKQQNEA